MRCSSSGRVRRVMASVTGPSARSGAGVRSVTRPVFSVGDARSAAGSRRRPRSRRRRGRGPRGGRCPRSPRPARRPGRRSCRPLVDPVAQVVHAVLVLGCQVGLRAPWRRRPARQSPADVVNVHEQCHSISFRSGRGARRSGPVDRGHRGRASGRFPKLGSACRILGGLRPRIPRARRRRPPRTGSGHASLRSTAETWWPTVLLREHQTPPRWLGVGEPVAPAARGPRARAAVRPAGLARSAAPRSARHGQAGRVAISHDGGRVRPTRRGVDESATLRGGRRRRPRRGQRSASQNGQPSAATRPRPRATVPSISRERLGRRQRQRTPHAADRQPPGQLGEHPSASGSLVDAVHARSTAADVAARPRARPLGREHGDRHQPLGLPVAPASSSRSRQPGLGVRRRAGGRPGRGGQQRGHAG